MTSYPACTSRAAATELSTPPDIATSTRPFTAPPPIADCGFGIADSNSPPPIRNPHSAFRILFSSVQHRAQGPHLFDDLRQRGDHGAHILRGIVLPERKAQRGD